jgi:hypothetical protein
MVGTREIMVTGCFIIVPNTNLASNVDTRFTEKPNMSALSITANPPI